MQEKEFFEFINSIEETIPLGERMKQNSYPFVIWGTGSLSYSIKKYMDVYEIPVSCYWVDGDICEKEKDGIPVYSQAEVIEKFERFNLVFGHSYYELKNEIVKTCRNINEVFCIPNVCYGRFEKLEKSFLLDNYKVCVESISLLEDDSSKDCIKAFWACKISENVDYIINVLKNKINYFENDIYGIGQDEVYVDMGAYTGDSIELFLKATKNQYKKIYAFEPEVESFQELEKYVDEKNLDNIELHQKGGWFKEDTLCFSLDKESSSISTKDDKQVETIKVDALDSMLMNDKVTLVKINYMSGIEETIQGMKRIMTEEKPKLVVTVGFDENALLTIPALIKRINPSYKLYLRFAAAMPARLLLFAI